MTPSSPEPSQFLTQVRYGLQRRSAYHVLFLAGVAVFGGGLAIGLFYHLASSSRLPGITLNHLAGAEASAQRGEFDSALEEYRVATTIAPDDYQARIRLGTTALAAGRFDEAIVAFQQALRRIPGDPNVHYLLGLAYLQTGRLDLVVDHNRAAIRMRPDFAEAYSSLATAELRLGDTSAAIGHYEQALALNPNLTSAVQGLRSIRGFAR